MADNGGSDKYETRVTAAIDYLRGNVKWTLVAFGAIGTTLLAGSQLSNLGKFEYNDPRLIVALSCAIAALFAAAFAIYSALKVAFTGYTEFYHLDQTATDHIEDNPALLEGYATVAALREAYKDAVAKRHAELIAEEKDPQAIDSNQYWFEYLDTLVDHVVAYARYDSIRTQAKRSRAQMTGASIVAAIGLVGFAWAANPPAGTPPVATTIPSATTAPTQTTTNKIDASVAVKAPTGPPIIWTQLRPDTAMAKGELIARAIVAPGAACPPLIVDDTAWPMQIRSDGGDPGFPVKLCETALPGNAKAQIGHVTLKRRPRTPHKIVVIGDTGCRITDYTSQSCDSAVDWPFFRVAAAAAKTNPDLIIDVGDYHYREMPCAGRPGCTGSPYGDNWRTWADDFFTPAAALLTAAPWLMVRGNHEDCTRAGAGWYLLLAPTLGMQPGLRCPPDTDPYVLNFSGLRVVALDTASAEGFDREKRVAKYREQLRELQTVLDKPPAPAGETWLLLHQPLWVSQGRKKNKMLFESDLYDDLPTTLDAELRARLREEIVNPINTIRQWTKGNNPLANPNANKAPDQGKEQLADETKPPAVSRFALVLSGDVHTFQTFVPDHATVPFQLVAGNSGDVLDRADKYPGAIDKLDTQPAILFGQKGEVSMRHVFGFMVLEKTDVSSSWTATLHNVDGKPIAQCELKRPGGSCHEL
jgi:hypothetical protein